MSSPFSTSACPLDSRSFGGGSSHPPPASPRAHTKLPLPSSRPPMESAKAGPALCEGMERKNLGCCEAPKKLGLSFSIEEILKRPAKGSDGVGREGAGGPDARPAARAGSRPERPPQDQPQGKCLLVISCPLPGLQDPAGPRQRKSYFVSTFISTEERALKFGDCWLGWDLKSPSV